MLRNVRNAIAVLDIKGVGALRVDVKIWKQNLNFGQMCIIVNRWVLW